VGSGEIIADRVGSLSPYMPRLSRLDHKIWGIAWPAILSNISIPLLGLVDAAILGHLGSTRYLGAVAIGGALLSFLYWGFSFLRMGTTGQVAKASGAGRHDLAALVLARSSVLALVLAAAVVLLHPLWLELGLTLMAPQPELAPLAASYVSIRVFSAPAVLVTYTIVGWFIGRQDTRWPMVIVVATNGANIALDFLLIVGLGLNSDGAALATLLSEYVGVGIALWAVWRQPETRPGPGFRSRLSDLNAYGRILRSNGHLFIRTVCLLASFAFFTAAGDKLGPDVLAANALLMQLLLLSAYGLDGFAFAAEGLAGNYLGAGNLEAFYRAVNRCALWCLGSGAAISLCLALFHFPVIHALSDITAVRELMRAHYLWLVALPLAAAPSYLLDGVFIGSAETRYMMITMLFSSLAVYLPLWYLTRSWGNHGLWFAFIAFNAARGISLYFYYRRLSTRGGWLPGPPSAESG
jgi:MATE family multidrug resistance protein